MDIEELTEEDLSDESKVYLMVMQVSTKDINGYSLQYKINDDVDWVITESNPEEINNLCDGDIIYARLVEYKEDDTEKVRKTGSLTIRQNKEAPQLEITEGYIDSDSLEVNVVIKNEETANLPDEVNFSYYIKKKNQKDKDYAFHTTMDFNVYEYTELNPSTTYVVKVETMTADNQVIYGTKEITTKSVPQPPVGSEKLKGSVCIYKQKWHPDLGTCEVTLYTSKRDPSTKEYYKIEYQIDGTEDGKWTRVDRGTVINNLEHGQTIYARVSDGLDYGRTYKKLIKDNYNPVVGKTVETGPNSYKFTAVNARDSKSGLEEPIKYKFYIKYGSGSYEPMEPTESSSLCLTGIPIGKYAIKVEVTDRAGRVGRTLCTKQIYGGERTISYDTNGGTGVPDTIISNEGKTIRLSSKKTVREGYKFKGWDIEGKTYGSSSIYKVGVGDVTCTAIWEETYVSRISFDKTKMYLSINKSDTITAKVYPDTALNKNLVWTSSDPSIATVSGDRSTVTIRASSNTGITKITATSTDGSNKSASCTVYVSGDIIQSTKVDEYPNSIIIELDDHNSEKCNVVNEIDLYDENGTELSYSIYDVYDSKTKGLPAYWNRGGSTWGYENLYDGGYSYSSVNGTSFLYSSSPGSGDYARLVLRASKGIANIRVCVGGYTSRTPRHVSFFRIDNFNNYSYSTNLSGRNNAGLTKLFESTTYGDYTALAYLTWYGYK